MPRLDELLSRGIELRNMDTGEPLSNVRDKIQSANAYLGAWPMVEALNQGAQIVITGRATDTGLTLAPMIHEFGWSNNDWNRLAAGTIAGHIIECGAQASGRQLPVRVAQHSESCGRGISDCGSIAGWNVCHHKT